MCVCNISFTCGDVLAHTMQTRPDEHTHTHTKRKTTVNKQQQKQNTENTIQQQNKDNKQITQSEG